MSLTNLKIVLILLTEEEAEVRFSADGMQGNRCLQRDGDGWKGVAGLPDDILSTVALSLFGPDNNGPAVDLPDESKMTLTVTKFVPGNEQELCGIVQMTNPEYDSDPTQLCCHGGQLCQPPGIYPGEFAEICQVLARLRAENNGGLPIKVIN